MDYADKEKQIHDLIGTVLVEDLMNPSMTLMENADLYGKYYSGYRRECMEKYLSLFHLKKKENSGVCQKEKN